MTSALWIRPERIKELSLLGVIVLAVVVFGFLVDDYYSGRFFNRVTTSVAITAVLAVAQTLVIVTRNIDLSVGSIVGVSAYLTGEFAAAHHDASPALAIALAVGLGALLGAVNGVIVAYGRVPAIIVTLGTLAIYRSWLVSHAESKTITADSLPSWVVDLPTADAGQRGRPGRAGGGGRRGRRRRRAPARTGPAALGPAPLRRGLQPRGRRPVRPADPAARAGRLRRLRGAVGAGRLPLPGPVRHHHGGRRPGASSWTRWPRQWWAGSACWAGRAPWSAPCWAPCSSTSSTRAWCACPRSASSGATPSSAALILAAVVADVAIGRRFQRRWSAEARPHTRVDDEAGAGGPPPGDGDGAGDGEGATPALVATDPGGEATDA